MNYDNPELIDKLAAEYVLGTLHGAARTRFEHLLKHHAHVQQAVTAWEQNFAQLAANSTEVAPPKAVWQGIQGRIDPADQHSNTSFNLWRLWSGVSTLVAVFSIVLLVQQMPLAPQGKALSTDHVGLVGQTAAPLWLISANLQTGQLTARAVNAHAAGVDKVFELWMLPNQGAPQSIGFMPTDGGSVTHALPAGLANLLRDSKGLAISIEPSGGSPTGLPTGPVIEKISVWEL